jgi:hypothetical protein
VTIAKRPSWRAEDSRRSASDLPVVTSKTICGELTRRANQCGARKGCQPQFSCPGGDAAWSAASQSRDPYRDNEAQNDGPPISNAPRLCRSVLRGIRGAQRRRALQVN